MSVTCYCDASWSKQTGGAWAVWIRSQEGRIVRHGRCPKYVKTSSDAELAAIYAAMYLAVRTWGRRVGKVLVRGDCQSALAVALEAPDDRPGRYATTRLQYRIHELIRMNGIKVETRWVRGHQEPSKSTAAYLNHQCDVLAWKTRRAGRSSGPNRASRRARGKRSARHGSAGA